MREWAKRTSYMAAIGGGYFNTASSTASSAPGLTAKAIRESMKSLETIKADLRGDGDRDGNLSLSRSNVFGGVSIVASPFLPHEQPAIQVRDIRLKDGTPLLSTQFLARENAWWRDRFGMRPVAFMVGDSVAAHPKVTDMLRKVLDHNEQQMLDIMLGRQP